MIGTCFLKTLVQFSIILMVLGLAKLALALSPLPFSQEILDEGLIYGLGSVVFLLVLRDLSSLITHKPDVKLSTSLSATEELAIAQQDSYNTTSTETCSVIVAEKSGYFLDVTVEQVIDASSDEEDVTLCDSMISVIEESSHKKKDFQVIVISSSDDEDEISEVSVDITSLLEEEEAAIRLRLEAEKMEIECRRLERVALQAFDTNDAHIGRQILRKRDELVLDAKGRRKEASEHMFRYHNPTYSNSKAGLTRLDLHGLYLDEAKARIFVHLDMCRKRSMKQTRIITGKGLHSISGKPVLKPLTLKLLQNQTDLKFMLQPGNTGMVVVKFEPRSTDLQA